MPLFVVKHQHDADRCPAGDPEQGPKMLEYLSDPAASGITVYAQAMADWQHTLHMILEASDIKSVLDFMAPFEDIGTIEVLPASSCETVVARGRC